MYSDRRAKAPGWLLPVIIIIAVVVVLACAAFSGSGRDISEEAAVSIAESIREKARQCYAVEGAYPPNLEYLEDNYGLQVNTRQYYISYEAFAANVPPAVMVVPKTGQQQ
ncbi:MAG: hypothetical protein IJH99_08345 [Eubacterium sp.]|nr:hypothetical protein [Eubacterium sp.]